ncbi:MAG: FAD:protein FMN transferase [Acidimicrobiales bacterium]
MPADRTFAAMGTRARVLVVDGPVGLADRLARRVGDLEARWSRFLPDSEVSRLNRAGGAPLEVSVDTIRLIDSAVSGWEATYGLFDPTVLGDLERAGYDRPFDDLPLGGRVAWPPGRPSWLIRGCAGIEIDHEAQTVRLPAGVGFDPGGIGKGLAADIVADEALAAGAAGVLVDLGGDVRVAGRPPHRAPDWVIEIDDPFGGPSIGYVELTDGAVATSSRARRRWTIDGRPRHHLIDPLLGTSVDSDVVATTVVAASGWQAEVLSKAAFVGGPVQGLGLVGQLGGTALLVDEDRRQVAGPGWWAFGRTFDELDGHDETQPVSA